MEKCEVISRTCISEITKKKKNLPCTDCGIQFNYWVMQFDHVRGRKKFNISDAGRHIKVTKNQLLNEINKCEVVCANCHHTRTYKTLTKERGKMKMSVLRSEMRRANKEHICKECEGKINYLDSYSALIGNFDGKFSTIHLHSDCENKFISKNHKTTSIEQGPSRIVPDPKEEEQIVSKPISDFRVISATEHIAQVAKERIAKWSDEVANLADLIESLINFHKRWQVERSNTLADRVKLLIEENREWEEAITHNTNIKEELADQLGVVLGNILWSKVNADDTISFSEIFSILASKLNKRAKFGYKLHNSATGETKMTHWQKALRFLETARYNWKVFSGPKNIHPEIRELLTKEEIELLERG